MIINLQAKNKEDWVHKVRTLGKYLAEKGYQDELGYAQCSDDQIGVFYHIYTGIHIYSDNTWLSTAQIGEWNYDDVFGLFDIWR